MLKTGRLDRKYNGIIECFSRTAKQEGVMSLWRGNTANVIRSVESILYRINRID